MEAGAHLHRLIACGHLLYDEARLLYPGGLPGIDMGELGIAAIG